MKKQLFTLALLTLGYVASSHSMGVVIMAQMTKINETMAAGTTQEVNAVAAYIVSETPKVHGQTVLRLEETKPGRWIITTENPGVASIVLEKKLSGYTNKFHAAEHDITVTGTADRNKKRVRDEDGLVVESVQSVVAPEKANHSARNHKAIMVDEIIEMDAEGDVQDDVMNDVE